MGLVSTRNFIQKIRPLKVDEACAFLGASTVVLPAVMSGCLGCVWFCARLEDAIKEEARSTLFSIRRSHGEGLFSLARQFVMPEGATGLRYCRALLAD